MADSWELTRARTSSWIPNAFRYVRMNRDGKSIFFPVLNNRKSVDMLKGGPLQEEWLEEYRPGFGTTTSNISR